MLESVARERTVSGQANVIYIAGCGRLPQVLRERAMSSQANVIHTGCGTASGSACVLVSVSARVLASDSTMLRVHMQLLL